MIFYVHTIHDSTKRKVFGAGGYMVHHILEVVLDELPREQIGIR